MDSPEFPASDTPCKGVARKGAARASVDADARDALVADLNGLLERHCQQLGDFVDGRLAARHQDLLRALSEELQPLRSPGKVAVRSVARKATPQGRAGTAASGLEGAAHAPEAAAYKPEQEVPSCTVTFGDAVAVPVSEREQTEAVPAEGTCDPPRSVTAATSQSSLSIDRFPSMSTDQDTFEQSERQRMNKSRMITHSPLYEVVRSLELKSLRKRKHSIRRFVESQVFETLMCLLILSNVCFFGFEVQSLMGVPEGDVPLHFKVVEYCYTGCFCLELLLRFLAYGLTQFFCGHDWSWNVIDFSLVTISLVELLLELLTSGGNHKFTYVRIIRMAKTVRIFRVVRIMKIFRPLRILVFSIMNTVRSLCWTLVLLAIVIYSFGVLFTMASSQALASSSCRDPALLEQYFGSLWISISSLFQSITGGMDWQFSANALSTLDPIWVALFVGFIAFSQFALLNVVTGVVCQTAMESAQQDEDIVVQSRLALKQKYVSQLEHLFRDHLDSDSSGKITLRKFESRLQDSSLQAYLDALDLTTEEAWNLFKLLDVHELAMIDVDDFVSGCLRLRGTARSIDIHMLMYESRWTMNKLTKVLVAVQDLSSALGPINEYPEATCPNRDFGAPAQGHCALSTEVKAVGAEGRDDVIVI